MNKLGKSASAKERSIIVLLLGLLILLPPLIGLWGHEDSHWLNPTLSGAASLAPPISCNAIYVRKQALRK